MQKEAVIYKDGHHYKQTYKKHIKEMHTLSTIQPQKNGYAYKLA